MGTGHFTRWLAEVSAPGSEIYAFDFSWPIIEKAKVRTRELSGVTLFRANARGRLPFPDEHFDIVFLRLAPLGAHGLPNAQVAYALLKPGGWFFEAGGKATQYETPPTEWAFQHGYEQAEYHVWQYRRLQSTQEYIATQMQREHMLSLGWKPPQGAREQEAGARERRVDDGVLATTYENLLIARKPKE
jgi:ubiquinone/menaquinone biosynthesis C-methylase UbiE